MPTVTHDQSHASNRLSHARCYLPAPPRASSGLFRRPHGIGCADLIAETDRRIIDLGGCRTSQRLGHGLRIMTPMWIGRIAILFLALTAASGAAFVSGFPRERRTPVKTGDAIAAAAVAAPTASGGDEGSELSCDGARNWRSAPFAGQRRCGHTGLRHCTRWASGRRSYRWHRCSRRHCRIVAQQRTPCSSGCKSIGTVRHGPSPTSTRALRADVEVKAAERQAIHIPKECGGCSSLSQIGPERCGDQTGERRACAVTMTNQRSMAVLFRRNFRIGCNQRPFFTFLMVFPGPLERARVSSSPCTRLGDSAWPNVLLSRPHWVGKYYP